MSKEDPLKLEGLNAELIEEAVSANRSKKEKPAALRELNAATG